MLVDLVELGEQACPDLFWLGDLPVQGVQRDGQLAASVGSGRDLTSWWIEAVCGCFHGEDVRVAGEGDRETADDDPLPNLIAEAVGEVVVALGGRQRVDLIPLQHWAFNRVGIDQLCNDIMIGRLQQLVGIPVLYGRSRVAELELQPGTELVSVEQQWIRRERIHRSLLSFWVAAAAGPRLVSWLDRLTQFGEQAADSLGNTLVSVNFPLPAALLRVGDQRSLGGHSFAQTWRVVRGGDELRAAQYEVALARTFGGQAQAVTELEFVS